MSQIVANLIAKLSGYSCGDFQPGACLFTPLPFEDHSSMSDRPEKQALGKTDQGNNGNDAHMDC